MELHRFNPKALFKESNYTTPLPPYLITVNALIPRLVVVIGKWLMTLCLLSLFTEYASVGYMAKRIQMRKNRFLALQKMAEQKKKEIMNAATNANNVGHDQGLPKQSVRDLLITNDDMTLWIFPLFKTAEAISPARLKHYRIFRSDTTAVFLFRLNHGFLWQN